MIKLGNLITIEFDVQQRDRYGRFWATSIFQMVRC